MAKNMEVQKYKQTTETSTKPCLLQDYLTKEDKALTRVFLVPKNHLYGIQPKEAYSLKSRKETERFLASDDGRGYLTLMQNPTLIIPLFVGDSVYMAITDGHHRARYVDRQAIPARLVTLEHATKIHNRCRGTNFTEDQFAEDIVDSMHLAEKSFDNMPLDKKPSPIVGVSSFEQLVNLFEELPHFAETGNPQQQLVQGTEFNILEAVADVVEADQRRRNFFDNMNA